MSVYYSDFFTIAYDSIIHIIISINGGWFIRLWHVIGASFFILLLTLHFIRNSWIKVRSINTRFTCHVIVLSGYLLFIVCLIEGFIGYLLCWGQMSYWGITVMISLCIIPHKLKVPWIGIIIGELIWNAAWTILNRIFVFHFIMGFLIVLLIIIHIILLHSLTSSNPFNNNNSLIISFSPIIFKDAFISLLLLVVSYIFLYYEPDIIGSSDNQIIANPLITPNNILPEWYFLIWYSILRCYPIMCSLLFRSLPLIIVNGMFYFMVL